MSATPFDLTIRAGRVFCPVSGMDASGTIAVRAGRIAAIGPNLAGEAFDHIEFSDGLLLPGLIDLHAHPANRGSVFGIPPDEHLLQRGTTTTLSQGDAGADNLDAYIRETVISSKTRIRIAVNLSRVGESTTDGCFENLDWADVRACVAAVERHREHVWGIAVNLSRHACGRSDPREVFRRGMEAAQRAGVPILFGMRPPQDIPFDEQVRHLRPGDVVTYCFRREPHCIVQNGRIDRAIREARDRGVLFDVGHGMASFDFEVAESAIRDGFPPDTISTDMQARHIGQTPPHDLPRVMSKLIAAGMPEADVFAAATNRPAKILGLDDAIGHLAPGTTADLTILQSVADLEWLCDVNGNKRQSRLWKAVCTIRDGEIASFEINTDARD